MSVVWGMAAHSFAAVLVGSGESRDFGDSGSCLDERGYMKAHVPYWGL
jgi:hypothetical protein